MSNNGFEDLLNRFRYMHMSIAEAIDVWRIVPRLVIAIYAGMLWWMVRWFTSATTIERVSCDGKLMIDLLDRGVDILWVQQLACTVTDVIVVAGPGAVHATFASVVAGLSTAVFALYTGSAKDWSEGAGWWKARDPSTTQSSTNNPAP